MYPPVPRYCIVFTLFSYAFISNRTPRLCTETCTINGLTIPKDASVTIFIQELHYSTEYWDEPDVFRPERYIIYHLLVFNVMFRFSPKEKKGRHPLCYMPFGWGPRNCVAMRFALMEAKMALVSVLREYKFYIAPDTEVYIILTCNVLYRLFTDSFENYSWYYAKPNKRYTS